MKMTPTFIHYHPSHTKVKPFAGQRQYLHFSATLRPWVLVWSQGLNQGPPALQWSAVSTKLALHYCQPLTEKPKHLKYFTKVCVMNNNSRDQKRQTSHQAQTNSRLWFKLNFLTTISGVCCFSLSTPFPAPNPLPLLACESRCLFLFLFLGVYNKSRKRHLLSQAALLQSIWCFNGYFWSIPKQSHSCGLWSGLSCSKQG